MASGSGFISGKVERLYFLPGYGCVATGWALNGLNLPVEYSLVTDTDRLSTPAEELLMSDRPDIRQALSLPPDIYRSPGFTAAFAEKASLQHHAKSLAVTYGDGSVASLPIDSAAIRLLGRSATPDTLLESCPRLPFSSQWPILRQSVVLHMAQYGAEATALSLEPAETAMFLACPSDRPGQFLLVDTLMQTDIGGAGLVIFVEPDAYSPQLADSLKQVEARQKRKVSIVTINDPQQALLTLPLIAKAINCRRLAFLASDVVATPDALSALAQSLNRAGDGLQIYPVKDPANRRVDRSAAVFSGPLALVEEAVAQLTPRFLGADYRFERSATKVEEAPVFLRSRLRVLTAGQACFESVQPQSDLSA